MNSLLRYPLFFALLSSVNFQRSKKKPHIIFIVADDLGWNDVGFHGSSQIPTPNIDAMAYSGIILNNYYVNPICTPSRSALMTGKYPIHSGMQHGVLDGAEPRGLPLHEKLLPEYLQEIGYENYIVGKWHLGSYKKVYTPLFRGFKSHFGFWIGHQDYFDHTSESFGSWGLDMRDEMILAKNLHGKYSTDIFTQKAVEIIQNHNLDNPLFLYLAHTAVHSGNSYNPLPAPDEYVSKFSYINNYTRQRFAGILNKLDESVGDVIEALSKRNMLDNCILIFTTDNGGPAAGFNGNAASNYPLKGVKNTLWEGGIRGTAFIWSPLLKLTKKVSKQMMHITDWLPTLLEAVNATSNFTLDGVNMWQTLSKNTSSNRKEILHNIDDIIGNAAITAGPWKYVKGDSYAGNWSNWYGPSGRNYRYNFTLLENCKSYNALKKLKMHIRKNEVKRIRSYATVECKLNTTLFIPCQPQKQPCLFNINLDPCEKYNVAEIYPEIVAELENKLQNYNKTSLPPGNLPRDPRGFPENWDYAWVNFGDFI